MKNISHILLVDDDEDDRIIFKSVVKDIATGIKITEADDGMQGVEILNTSHPLLPDIIFLDLNMPRMDGFAFLQTIKNKNQFASIPVAVYTTSSHERDIEKTYHAGANFFITKPSSIDEMKNLFMQVFNIRLSDLLSHPDRKNFVLIPVEHGTADKRK